MIVNLTPHPISLANEAGEVTETIAPHPAGPARCKTQSVPTGRDVEGVKVFRNTFGNVEGLPAPTEGFSYIVSSIVLAAVDDSRVDVVAPDTGPTAVRDENGRILAVRQFSGK